MSDIHIPVMPTKFMSLVILIYGQKVCNQNSYTFLIEILNAIIGNKFSNLL